MDRKVHSINKNHKWDYISSPHLLGENQVQENQRVLYGLIYKFLGETTKDNLFICDGKEELYNVGKYI